MEAAVQGFKGAYEMERIEIKTNHDEAGIMFGLALAIGFTVIVVLAAMFGYQAGVRSEQMKKLEDESVQELIYEYCSLGARIQHKGKRYHSICLEVKR